MLLIYKGQAFVWNDNSIWRKNSHELNKIVFFYEPHILSWKKRWISIFFLFRAGINNELLYVGLEFAWAKIRKIDNKYIKLIKDLKVFSRLAIHEILSGFIPSQSCLNFVEHRM